MKDDILLIIHNHYPTSPTIIDNAVANELHRLMCYREVKMFYASYNHVGACDIPENYLDLECIDIVKKSYPESMILEAIEKVKKEQK